MTMTTIRTNEDGSLDTIQSYGASVFLEQMDTGHWFMEILDTNGKRHVIHLISKRNIRATHEIDQ